MDVVNLYGSIPLTGQDNIYDVVCTYFADKRHLTVFREVDPTDFRILLHLALDSGLINIGGEVYKQKIGVAMGNNFSPTAAIVYMDFIENQILDKTRTRV